MRKYETYKDSGVQWMGEIPSHWELASLGRICTLRTGTTPKCYDSEIGKDTIDWYTPSDFTDSLVLLPSSRRLNKVEFENSGINYFPAKSVLIIGIGGTTGKTSYCQTQCYSNQQITALCPQDKINYVYLTLFLRSIRKNLLDTAPYTTLPILSNKFLSSIKVSLPPLPEQQHIVAFLDEKIAKIDEYIAKKEAEIESLKEWKKAFIAHIVTKGLNPQAKMKDSGVSWIGEVPEHWEIKRIASAFTENRTLNSNMEYKEAYKFNYGSLVRKDVNVNPDELEETYSKYTIINPDDIVINGLNLNYDFVSMRVAKAYEKGIITSAYLTMTPRESVVANYYHYLFKAMDAMKLFHGMGTGIRLTLSFAEMKKQQILFPPIEEQQAIVDYIDAATTKADKMIVELSYHVEHMKEYKQRLISDVVTGKINVQPA